MTFNGVIVDKHGDVTVERIVNNRVLLFVFCGQNRLPKCNLFSDASSTDMTTNKCFSRPAMHTCMFGVRSLLMDEKVLLVKKTWPMSH